MCRRSSGDTFVELVNRSGAAKGGKIERGVNLLEAAKGREQLHVWDRLWILTINRNPSEAA